MLELKLNQLKPGMVLSRDVTNFFGVLLLKSGRPLKTRDIKNFKAWGVTEAFVQEGRVEGSPQEDAPKVDPLWLRQAKEESAALFHHANSGHPIVMELERLCTLHRVRQISGVEGAHGD